MDIRLLARLLATERTVTALGAVAAAREATDDLSEPVRAQVAARLADGTFRVLVDGRAPLKLALPAGVKPGDVIELRIVNRNGNADGMDQPAEDGSALSSAGRLISALLSEKPGPPPQQAKPVLLLPPATPSELPEPLARAVEASGMFYESHQARWVDGEYPLERLLQEPQAQLGHSGAAGEAESTRAATTSQLALAAAVEADTAATEPPSASVPAAQSRAAEDQQLVAREALPLVRNQLDALESRHITWLGEIWPGQPMRWEIQADDSGRRDEADPEPGWSTRFSLELPQLGEVGADMAIGAGGIRLNLEARTREAAELMRAAAHELVESLAAAGVTAPQLQITCHDGAS